MNTPGIYGKLPSHGDFLQRNLPGSFVAEWDEWLQKFISGSKEQIGADWLDVYLTSPIWRYVLSSGVVDKHAWAGIMMPSVDLVGRYFPLTIALRLDGSINPAEFISRQSEWFFELEELSLHALDGECELDVLLESLAQMTMNMKTLYTQNETLHDSFDMHFEVNNDEANESAAYPHMLNIFMTKIMSSYSLWSTSGSERINPCMLTVKHLPTIPRVPAMLDGDWKRWGWQQPYHMRRGNINMPMNDVTV